jgi:hypothetical protein
MPNSFYESSTKTRKGHNKKKRDYRPMSLMNSDAKSLIKYWQTKFNAISKG